MLILSRQIGETIRIGDKVKITVVKIGHDKVAIGIDAPKDVEVHRGEVYEAIHDQDP